MMVRAVTLPTRCVAKLENSDSNSRPPVETDDPGMVLFWLDDLELRLEVLTGSLADSVTALRTVVRSLIPDYRS